ncbi:PREDICTED: tRNA(His) guanylyltransferase 2-like [Ipomoea nil]|uniref:tRNA(His) guanylyltransferase 2-like n=1 Tax=Ipomoea nil TaxID=35883 RepID=UPI0009013D99|nr:PREDICTED: tRNA(His) guanylyltransferase 2-like [Ipomoea nil]
MLGSTKLNWTLFVDGYGKDGKRIYDLVKGNTCHQCRFSEAHEFDKPYDAKALHLMNACSLVLTTKKMKEASISS